MYNLSTYMNEEQLTKEYKKLVNYQTGTIGVPEVLKPIIREQFCIKPEDLICINCAEKIKSNLSSRIKNMWEIKTFPHSYKGNISFQTSSAIRVETEYFQMKKDALWELKKFAAICNMDIVFDIEYYYKKTKHTSNKEDGYCFDGYIEKEHHNNTIIEKNGMLPG